MPEEEDNDRFLREVAVPSLGHDRDPSVSVRLVEIWDRLPFDVRFSLESFVIQTDLPGPRAGLSAQDVFEMVGGDLKGLSSSESELVAEFTKLAWPDGW
jgi:hypothetical protein